MSTLSPAHVAELAASGISIEVAKANGVYTEQDAAAVGRLLNYKGPAKALGDCLVYPFFGPDSKPMDYAQLKPANPKIERKGSSRGKPRKYECPAYVKSRAYFPVNSRPQIGDPAVPLIITEGPKKAVCLDANGFVVVGLVGVWNGFKERPRDEAGEAVGPRELIPDLAAVAWERRPVWIVYDSDAATNGLVRAAEVELEKLLSTAGAVVKVVRLPPGPSGEKVGADDYIVANGAEKFACLLADARPASEACNDPRPEVKLTTEVHEVAEKVRAILADVPGLYSRGGVLVQETQEILSPVPLDAMPELLSRHIRFVELKETAEGSTIKKRVAPTREVGKLVFARPIEPIREVLATATYPVMLADNRILAKSGYDAGSKTLVTLPAGFAVDVPEMPTRQEATQAARRLMDLFCDFPFVDEGDDESRPGKVRGCHSRAAVVAFLLTVLARPAIHGPTPFTLVVKNTAGTGGSLLVETLGRIVAGKEFAASSYPSGDHNEMRKLITAWCAEGRPVVNLDNLVGEVGDAELCRAITSTVWSDRILGVNRTYSGPFSTVLIGSANNARLGADMPRRVLSIRMETDLARPEERGGFKYDLTTYPTAHRRRLITDALTVLRAWVVAGRPQAILPAWGKFEAWSAVVRQACVFAGLAAPYLPTPSRKNSRTRLLRTIAEGMLDMDPNGEGMTAAALVRRLTTTALDDSDAIRDAADAAVEMLDRVTAGALGKVLSNEQNRNLDGIKITELAHRSRTNVAKWVAVRIDVQPEKPAQESPASPANGQTCEQKPAGDAGDKNGGHAGSPAGRTMRRGGVKSNQYRGTPLDKEGSG